MIRRLIWTTIILFLHCVTCVIHTVAHECHVHSESLDRFWKFWNDSEILERFWNFPERFWIFGSILKVLERFWNFGTILKLWIDSETSRTILKLQFLVWTSFPHSHSLVSSGRAIFFVVPVRLTNFCALNYIKMIKLYFIITVVHGLCAFTTFSCWNFVRPSQEVYVTWSLLASKWVVSIIM